jgi:hypothetical protein
VGPAQTSTTKRYTRVPGAAAEIRASAASWWQQTLEETILGVLALGGSELSDDRAVGAALSEGSLTAAAMAGYHLDAVLMRQLRIHPLVAQAWSEQLRANSLADSVPCATAPDRRMRDVCGEGNGRANA